jgi:photosystem II stability/assembly factor-like uncharacterized protein
MKRPLHLLTTAALLLGLAFRLRPAPAPERPAHVEKRPDERAWLQRTFPYFRADPHALRDALEQAKVLRRAPKRQAFAPWTFAGPLNVGGRISDVAVAPDDPDRLYAAAATGGVFTSADRGRTWTPIFDEQALLTIGDLALDPSDPDVIYVGTGEANGGHNNFAGGGLYKSEDGGASWRFMGLGETVSIGRVVVDPSNPKRVFAAALGSYFAPTPERGLYRSEDGGESWTRVLAVNDSTGVIDVVIRPDDPNTIFAATWQRVRRVSGSFLYGEGSAVWRSRDGGDTWERLGPAHGLPDPEKQRRFDGRVRIGRIGLALCRDHPDVMYALFTDGAGYLGLFRTDDGGDTWRDADPNRGVTPGLGGFSWYFGQVRVHPSNPDVVYVMDVLFMRSGDGGSTWTTTPGIHVDHHALTFFPDDPETLLNGNDGGVALSTDGGFTWTRAGDLPNTQFYEIAFDPSRPERLYGGTQDNGTVRTLTGAADDWTRILGGDGFYVVIDPEDPNTIYAETQWGDLRRSQTFTPSFVSVTTGIDPNEKANWDTPLVIDPNDPAVLYTGTNRVYRTTDRAASWTAVSGNLTKGTYPLLGTISTIAVAPSDSDVLYAGTDDGNVWVSDDYGATWRDVTGTLPTRWVTRIAVHPDDARTAYVSFSGLKWKSAQPHVFRTRDLGATWEDVSAGLPDAPVNALVVDPAFPEVIYVGTDVGAYVSPDEGRSWQALMDGLPNVVVNDMRLIPDERVLLAGTHGRGIYRLDLSNLTDLVTAVEPSEAPPSGLTLDPGFPNPFSGETTLAFTLPAPARVRLAVYDALGRRVRTLFDGPAPAGTTRLTWDGADGGGRPLAAGIYLARLTTPGGRRTVTMTLAR